MKNFFRSFVYAFQGMMTALADQRNIRVLAAVAVLVVAAGFYFGITATEWCLVLLCVAVVIGLEMINSSIEGLVDLVTMEKKPLAGKIKDIAAGAVLFASVISAIVGVIIFVKYIIA